MTPCMWHLKCETNEFIYETDSDQRADLCSQGVGVGKAWELAVSRCKLGHRMARQQGPTVQHGEVYSTSCDEPQRESARTHTHT